MNFSQEQLQTIIGRTLKDTDGEKIGKINDVYLDDETGQPEWLAVNTGLFGTRVSFVPMANVSMTDDDAVAPYPTKLVKDAPSAEADGSLSQDEEAQLYAHYGLQYSENASDSGLPSGERNVSSEDTGYDTSGPTTDDAMTRSEEEMRVAKTTQQSGKARLRKYVVTEQQTVTVPVSHEEVRIEREPITGENYDAATSGPDISEEEHEIVLNEERVVVSTEAVPKERVRVGKETVVEDQQVSAQVRKEQIEFDDETKGQ